MSDREKSLQGLRALFLAGVSVIALAVCSGHSTGQTSEIDSYEAAVKSQNKVEALTFINAFRSSHLVGDLIQSLSPEVAQQVCVDLKGGGPARARKACEALPKAVATQPVVAPAEIAPAAGSATISSAPTEAQTSARAPSDEPRGGQGAGDKDKAGGTDLVYPPVAATTPAAGNGAAGPISTSADTSTAVPSDAETDGGHISDDTDQVGDTAPAAGSVTVGPVLTSATTPTWVPSGIEDGGQVPNHTDQVGSPEVLYLPIVAIAPAAGNPTVNSVSVSARSDDERKSNQGTTGNRGKAGSTNVLLPALRTPSTPVIAAVGSMSTGTSTSVPSDDQSETVEANGTSSAEVNTSDAQSSSSAQSSDGKSKAKSGKDKSGKDKGSSDQSASAESSSSAQSDGGQSSSDAQSSDGKSSKDKDSKDKGDKDKGSKDKGGKDKGGKDKGGKDKGGKDKGGDKG